MTGGIYDHLLIIGTFCSFIRYDQRVATSQLVNSHTLDFTEVQPEKVRVRGNPRKGIISVRTGFYASREAGFCVPDINVYALTTYDGKVIFMSYSSYQ